LRHRLAAAHSRHSAALLLLLHEHLKNLRRNLLRRLLSLLRRHRHRTAHVLLFLLVVGLRMPFCVRAPITVATLSVESTGDAHGASFTRLLSCNKPTIC
jgi:hypothetical protein